MVIGVLTTSYPRGPHDLAGRFVADRVQALADAGHTVEVLAGGGASELSPYSYSSPSSSSDLSSSSPSVTITRLPSRFASGPDLFGGAGAPEALETGGAASLLAAARFSAALTAAAAAATRARRWSRIESHWLAPCALAALAGAPDLPHRAYAHSGDVALLERLPLGRTLAARLGSSGADLVFVSEALRARFGRLAGREVGAVERLPLPPGLFAPRARARADDGLRAALDLPRGGAGAVVLGVARLVPIKGYDLLVRACARLARGAARPPVTLALLGEGPERERLGTLARRLGVPLVLRGCVPRDAVADHLRAADVYAQPSRVLANGRTEGLPVAALEALAVGLPIVASDSGGLAELADGGASGVASFAAGDVTALTRALAHALDAPVTVS